MKKTKRNTQARNPLYTFIYSFIYLLNGMDAKNGHEYIHYFQLKRKKAAHHIRNHKSRKRQTSVWYAIHSDIICQHFNIYRGINPFDRIIRAHKQFTNDIEKRFTFFICKYLNNVAQFFDNGNLMAIAEINTSLEHKQQTDVCSEYHRNAYLMCINMNLVEKVTIALDDR